MLYNDATKGKRKNYDAFHNFYNITPKKLFIWYPAYFRQQNGVLHRNYGMLIRLIISMLLYIMTIVLRARDTYHIYYNIAPKKLCNWCCGNFRQQNDLCHRYYVMTFIVITSMHLSIMA